MYVLYGVLCVDRHEPNENSQPWYLFLGFLGTFRPLRDIELAIDGSASVYGIITGMQQW